METDLNQHVAGHLPRIFLIFTDKKKEKQKNSRLRRDYLRKI